MNEQNSRQDVQASADAVYEAPAIETVLSNDDLEREVFYDVLIFLLEVVVGK